MISFGIQFALFLIFLVIYWIKGNVQPTLYVLMLPLLMLQMAMLSLGVGIIISALTTKYRDLVMLVGFGVQLWMYGTPVAYDIGIVPPKYMSLYTALKSGKTGMAVVKMIAIYLAQIIIGYCVFRFTEIDIKWVTYCHPIYRLGDFAIGGFLAAIYRNSFQKRAPVSKVMCSILELAAILVNLFTCVYFAYAPEHTTWATFTVLFIPSSILLIYAFSFDNGMISRLLKNRIVYWLADISPYAFLIHRLVISYYHLFVVKTLHREHFNFAFVIMIPFVVTVALVYTYRFFEKKVLRRAKSK